MGRVNSYRQNDDIREDEIRWLGKVVRNCVWGMACGRSGLREKKNNGKGNDRRDFRVLSFCVRESALE